MSLKYFRDNHLAFVALVVAIGMPFATSYIEQNDFFLKETKKYTYIGSYQNIETGIERAPFELLSISIEDAGDDLEESLSKTDCFYMSVSARRSDAYRCVTEDSALLDPCFLDPFNSAIVSCPHNPYKESEYFMTTIPDELNIVHPESETPSPWYIKLFDRGGCKLLTGATNIIADKRVDYWCTGSVVEHLFLPITRDGNVQKISCLKEGKIEECAIKEVWY